MPNDQFDHGFTLVPRGTAGAPAGATAMQPRVMGRLPIQRQGLQPGVGPSTSPQSPEAWGMIDPKEYMLGRVREMAQAMPDANVSSKDVMKFLMQVREDYNAEIAARRKAVRQGKADTLAQSRFDLDKEKWESERGRALVSERQRGDEIAQADLKGRRGVAASERETAESLRDYEEDKRQFGITEARLGRLSIEEKAYASRLLQGADPMDILGEIWAKKNQGRSSQQGLTPYQVATLQAKELARLSDSDLTPKTPEQKDERRKRSATIRGELDKSIMPGGPSNETGPLQLLHPANGQWIDVAPEDYEQAKAEAARGFYKIRGG